MLFKLSFKNIKKSFKDYSIYFLTLVLGVAIFYVFNSMDAQEAMLNISESKKMIVKLLVSMLSAISMFISVILGFLIVYANNFLIKRRKKEFGTYMLLGMGKRKISQILVCETIMIGIISLVVGLLIGIFGSQLMSVLVAKLFEADMTKFQFVFSSGACIKTSVYFGIMYLAVLIFNTFAISKYKLIDLLTAIKKNEKVKIKNTFVCVIVFLASIAMLAWAYYKVTVDVKSLFTESFAPLLPPIICGCVGTFLFFWSVSGFLLKVVQANKKVYLKEMNMFVLRQINAKINTTVFSMTIICLMLFVTICVLSSAISLNNSFTKSLKEMVPMDINLAIAENEAKDTPKTILEKEHFDMNKFKDIIETKVYATKDVTLQKTLGDEILREIIGDYPYTNTDVLEEVMKVSDYNKVAKGYGLEQYTLKDNEYVIVCNFNTIKQYRNKALNNKQTITINQKEYTPKYNECKNGFIEIGPNPSNFGIIIVPDNCEISNIEYLKNYLIANYNLDTKEEITKVEQELEKICTEISTAMYKATKNEMYDSATGLSAIITFIALYIGIIFLIASSAILALKELSESSDNKQRYSVLRKIGTDEKMINKALFMQIGIFFLIPLALAIVHSIFGIQFAIKVLETMIDTNDLVKPIILTALFISLIYGGYFIATYIGSKNIIKED